MKGYVPLWYILTAALLISFIVLNLIGVENLPWYHSPHPDHVHQMDALRLLADWTKWLVPVNAALSLASIYLEKSPPMNAETKQILRCAGTSFIMSLIAAGILLGAIAGAAEEIPRDPSVFTFKQFGLFQLANLAFLEHAFFVLGLGFLVPLVWPKRGSSGETPSG